MGYQFLTDCVHIETRDVPALEEMIDGGREITWETFRQHVPVGEVQGIFPFYAYHKETYNQAGELTCGFHIKDDYAVGFWVSKFKGRRCYYITHSAIEYIFTKV